MSDLQKVQIKHAPFSNRIVLARFGKDPSVALETRDCMDEFLQTLVSYICDHKVPDVGHGGELNFGGGDEQYVLKLTRLPEVSP